MALGVGLFCGVLFFVDGLSASMTQRAVAPLSIDMQHIVARSTGATITLTQTITPIGGSASGGEASVSLEISNLGEVDAHEVIVRSLTDVGVTFVAGSASVDGAPITTVVDNPFAHGTGRTGYNLGTVATASTRQLVYRVRASTALDIDAGTVRSTVSSREQAIPVPAGRPMTSDLRDLAAALGEIDGVGAAAPLSIADLGTDTIAGNGRGIGGPVKIFGFDHDYAARRSDIRLVDGTFSADGAVLSAEAARRLGVAIGELITVTLPDATDVALKLSGVADLTSARSLFSSRRGGDLETFIYTANSVVVSTELFTEVIQPAFDRAAATRNGRLKSPPIREVDVFLDRERLDADPARALAETTRIGARLREVAAESDDYVLDNISNTLAVAAEDAAVAKRLFVFLGVPGGLLAAMLAAYAGSVLAEAQRREQAMLRIRGASRRHLLRMLVLRTSLITVAGSVVGLVSGYSAVAAFLGRHTLDRAGASSLAVSALIGTAGGLTATGLALYLVGRRSIDRQINDDRARLDLGTPLWRRIRLDLLGTVAIVSATVVAIRLDGFAGAPGSVYFGRSVQLNVALLALPLLVWTTGGLLTARVVDQFLTFTRPASSDVLGRPLTSLYRRSIGRRPRAVGNGALVLALIVALATTLAAFTASYDAAKRADARYATGADIRITPSPTAPTPLTAADATRLTADGVASVTPVIYELSNVILRSARTSDPANLAAVDPRSYPDVAPLAGSAFTGGDGRPAAPDAAVRSLLDDPTAILLSEEMAAFLRAEVGDTLDVLLARATDAQVEVRLRVTGLYRRLPGFPAGAEALMSIHTHTRQVPSKHPDFFLAATDRPDDRGLAPAVAALTAATGDDLVQIETRATVLAADQSSLAALNIAGLTELDTTFSLAMTIVTIAIFVFGLLLQRRREYVTLRAQGLEARTVRLLIALEAFTVAVAGSLAGVLVGIVMGAYFVATLRPLFVLSPAYTVSVPGTVLPVVLVLAATIIATLGASHLVNQLEPTELLRDE